MALILLMLYDIIAIMSESFGHHEHTPYHNPFEQFEGLSDDMLDSLLSSLEPQHEQEEITGVPVQYKAIPALVDTFRFHSLITKEGDPDTSERFAYRAKALREIYDLESSLNPDFNPEKSIGIRLYDSKDGYRHLVSNIDDYLLYYREPSEQAKITDTFLSISLNELKPDKMTEEHLRDIRLGALYIVSPDIIELPDKIRALEEEQNEN